MKSKQNYELKKIYYGTGGIGINAIDLIDKINSHISIIYHPYLPAFYSIVFEDYSFICKNDILKFWYFDIKYLNTFIDIIQDKIMNCEEYSDNIKDEICSEIQNFKIKNI